MTIAHHFIKRVQRLEDDLRNGDLEPDDFAEEMDSAAGGAVCDKLYTAICGSMPFFALCTAPAKERFEDASWNLWTDTTVENGPPKPLAAVDYQRGTVAAVISHHIRRAERAAAPPTLEADQQEA